MKAFAADICFRLRCVCGERRGRQALFLQLTQVKARVGFLIWFALFRYLECGEALWKYPAYTLWISSSCLSSEQLAAFNSEWLSAGEPCVVGRRKYNVSSTSQLRSWALLGAPWETKLCFLFDVGQAPRTLNQKDAVRFSPTLRRVPGQRWNIQEVEDTSCMRFMWMVIYCCPLETFLKVPWAWRGRARVEKLQACLISYGNSVLWNLAEFGALKWHSSSLPEWLENAYFELGVTIYAFP